MTTTQRHETKTEVLIRTIMEDKAQAIRDKDAARALEAYAPDVSSFDLIEPLRQSGAGVMRQRLEGWLTSFNGPIEFEQRDLEFVTADEAGFCYSLNHVKGKSKEGPIVDMWWRATECFRRIDGRWLITHTHSSVPFEMPGGKARMDLKP